MTELANEYFARARRQRATLKGSFPLFPSARLCAEYPVFFRSCPQLADLHKGAQKHRTREQTCTPWNATTMASSLVPAITASCSARILPRLDSTSSLSSVGSTTAAVFAPKR